MNLERRPVAWLTVLLVVAGCQAKADPSAATQTSVAPAAQPVATQEPAAEAPKPPPAQGPRAEPTPSAAAAPLSADSYAELIDAVLSRDLFKVKKDSAEARFGKFMSFRWKQPYVLTGEGPREEFDIGFNSCTPGPGECIGSVDLSLYADNETEALAAYRALEKQFKAKLGKVKRRSNADGVPPSLGWMIGREMQVLLSAAPSDRRKAGQWSIDINIQPPEES